MRRERSLLVPLLSLTAVFGVLLWPMLGLFAVLMDLVAIIWLFTIHPALALIPVSLTAIAIWLYARWEQRRFRPPGM